MLSVLIVLVVTAAASILALRPDAADTPLMWLGLLVPYTALSVAALVRLRAKERLRLAFRYHSGDIALGALTAVGLLIASWWARSSLAPHGSAESTWLKTIYGQTGDPEVLQGSVILTGALLLLAIEEELVWRGWVLLELGEKFGPRVAWPLTALLYAVSVLPTVWTMRTPEAGLNPLIPFAALGCGIVWSYTAARTRRLLPSMISHAVFTYFSATQFRIPGMD